MGLNCLYFRSTLTDSVRDKQQHPNVLLHDRFAFFSLPDPCIWQTICNKIALKFLLCLN